MSLTSSRGLPGAFRHRTAQPLFRLATAPFTCRALCFTGVISALGCSASGSIRTAISAGAVAGNCSEVLNLVSGADLNWSASYGLQSGETATFRAALQASSQLEVAADNVNRNALAICSKLASDLSFPVNATDGYEACRGAIEASTRLRTQLGPQADVKATDSTECTFPCQAQCDPTAPQGPCAQVRLRVAVTGARDPEAAERYSHAFETSMPTLLEVIETGSDGRELIADAATAIELGLNTGAAVQQGSAASAMAATACILPRIYAAKARLERLHAQLRNLRLLARAGGRDVVEPRLAQRQTALPKREVLLNTAAPLSEQYAQDFVKLFGFPDGGFAAQIGSGMVGLTDNNYLLVANAQDPNTVPGEMYCNVGPGHRVACLRQFTITANGKVLGSQLVLFESARAPRLIDQVTAKEHIHGDGIAFDAAGNVLIAYSWTKRFGDRFESSSQVVRGNQLFQLPFRPDRGSLEMIGSSGRGDPPIQFVSYRGRTSLLYHSGRTLLLSPLERPDVAIQIAESSAYDVRALEGGDGVLYVFYHDPNLRSLRVAHSSDGVTFQDLLLDTRESGWQLEAVPTEQGAMAVYYYYRDSYFKGLRAVTMQGGRLRTRPNTFMREKRWNAGWHPHLASDGNGQSWLTYQDKVSAGTRVWSHLNSSEELTAIELREPDSGYKNWFLQAGAGAWYTFWSLRSPAPESKDLDGSHLNDTRYKIDPTLLLSASFEARFGPLDFGFIYASDYLEKKKRSFAAANSLLGGNVRISDLVPGHDIKVEGLWGRYHGSMHRALDIGGSDEATLDTDYVDTHLYALNQWRIKYGLAFARYALPAPIQTFYAPALQTHYTFGTSEIRNVYFNDIDLALGYSMLDYLSKYENSYLGPIADVALQFGLTAASFSAINTPAGDVSSALGLHLKGQLQLGGLWMNRFESLAGFGIYIRPFYAIEGSFSGSGRPDDRKAKDADKDDASASFTLTSVRHGPWLDLGLFW